MLDIIISHTAYQNGWETGQMVCGLTNTEKAWVKEGKIICFKSRPHIHGIEGITWRTVVCYRGRFYPRIPNKEILQQLERK